MATVVAEKVTSMPLGPCDVKLKVPGVASNPVKKAVPLAKMASDTFGTTVTEYGPMISKDATFPPNVELKMHPVPHDRFDPRSKAGEP